MIFHPVAQRSEEWHALRLGIPTASDFKKIVTPTGKLSSQHIDYLHVLLAEWFTGHVAENFKSEWMQRGVDQEDGAIAAYEFLVSRETQPGGFFTTHDGLVGASPDRLDGDKYIVEIKCPLAPTHMGYLLNGLEGDHKPQMQGQLWVCERESITAVSYHPEMPPATAIYKRDEQYIKLLSAALRIFTDTMLELRTKLTREYGAPRWTLEKPKDVSKDFVSDQDVEDILAANRLAAPL